MLPLSSFLSFPLLRKLLGGINERFCRNVQSPVAVACCLKSPDELAEAMKGSVATNWGEAANAVSQTFTALAISQHRPYCLEFELPAVLGMKNP